jgi:hypothetical protein
MPTFGSPRAIYYEAALGLVLALPLLALLLLALPLLALSLFALLALRALFLMLPLLIQP